MVSKEELEELEKIKKQSNEPRNEEEIVHLVKNKIVIKDKEKKKIIRRFNQFKVSIPKKFVDILKLDEEKDKAKFTLIKKENKLIMEIIRG